MSTRTITGRLGLAGIALTLGAAVLVGFQAGPAGAAVTCTIDEFLQPQVLMSSGGDRVALRVSGTDIQYDSGSGYQSCDGATTTDTIKINVRDLSSGNTTLVIDLSGGPFAPGFEDEPGDSDEIEWDIRLRAGTGDQVVISGTPGPDEWTFGDLGFNLNPAEEGFGTGSPFDNDAIAFTGVDRVVMQGMGGIDGLRAQGGVATGGPLPRPTTLEGGGALDVLEGGSRADRLVGGGGGDEIAGGGGHDVIVGGPGGDDIAGGGGHDSIRSGTGNDFLSGGSGDDLLNGGAGRDWCSGGPGSDTFRSCERGPRD